jgi:hypothetical protein
MAEFTNREKALNLAVGYCVARAVCEVGDPLAHAERFLCFLEAHDKQDAAQPPQDNANVAPGAEPFKEPKPRQKRTSVKPAAQDELPIFGSLPMVPAGTGTAPQVELSLDDVRRALTEVQTRKNKDAAMAILGKYAPTKTTGSLPKDKYATVIAECKAAL